MDILNDVLYVVAQGIGIPVVIVLLALIVAALVCVGAVLVEFFTERTHYKAVMPQLIEELEACADDDPEAMVGVIESSGLLRRQKDALSTVASYGNLPHDALNSLAKTYLAEEADFYSGKLTLTDTIARVAPMFGLMGTLIPLGPGIVALSSGDLETLGNSLSIAFNTTIAGLISAAVCVIVSKVRQRWYKGYLSSEEAAMNCLLEKFDFLHGYRTPDAPSPELDERFQQARSRVLANGGGKAGGSGGLGGSGGADGAGQPGKAGAAA